MDQGISDMSTIANFLVFLSGIRICVCLTYISKAFYLLDTTDCYLLCLPSMQLKKGNL